MGFDLLANPFAVLGLAGSSPVGTISSRARELGTGEASAASRILIAPRTRLTAEVSFLPGATQTQVDDCLRTLREGGEPDLWPLAPIARANVLAHLASLKNATPSQLRDLVSMQETAPTTAIEAVDRGRSAAGMPPASPEMADTALQALADQHAEAMVDGILAHEGGADFLSGLLRESGSAVTPRGIFLRQCTAGWERAKSADLSRIIETAEPLETILRENPGPESAGNLTHLIQELAVATRPQREAARLLGLPHEPSLDARGRWQSVALDMNNRLDAIPEAVTVLEALVNAFDDQDELQARITKNLLVCRERVTSGEGTPLIRRLTKAIAAATAKPGDFDQCGLVDGRKTPACPATVAELHDSFIAAARNATSELPWSMLRGLTLVLHNEHKATAAAWSLTILAIWQASLNKAGDTVLPLLLADRSNLRSQILQREFDVAIRSKRKGAMRRIVAELVTLADTAAEKAEHSKLLWKLRRQAVGSYLKRGFWTAVAGLMAVGYLNQAPSSVRTASAPAAQQPTQYVTPRQVPAVVRPTVPTPAPPSAAAPSPAPATTAPAVDRTATQPPPGNAPLTISGLRWCRYTKVKLTGAEAYIEGLRPDPNLKIDRFNEVIDQFNAFIQTVNTSCGNYTYRKSDAVIVDAEVDEQRSALTAMGRKAVEGVYLAPSAPAAASVPAYVPPSTYVPPAPVVPTPSPNAYRPAYMPPPAPGAPQPDQASPAPASASYMDGQNDRRAWESLIAGMSGPSRDGAGWWAGVRSTQRPPTCSSVPGGSDPVAAAAGCNQARIRLGTPDRRRRAEPDYRAGWNNP